MRKSLTATALLLAAAFPAAPTSAQIAGNPGNLHTATPYMAQQWMNKPAAAPSGANIDLFGPFSGFASGFGAAMSGAASQHGCAASQDFNGRYTATCAP